MDASHRMLTRQLHRLLTGTFLTRAAANGRGLVTTKPVVAGELLLISEPLDLVSGPAEQVPSFAQLQQRLLRKKLTASDAAWLQQLYNGENDSTLQNINLSSFPTSSSTSQTSNPLSEDVMMRMVAQNAISEEKQDLAASASRGSDLSSLLGIWPEAALANHSCLPSAVVYALDDRLVVRAAKDLPAGAEISRSYIGVEALGTLEARREALEAR